MGSITLRTMLLTVILVLISTQWFTNGKPIRTKSLPSIHHTHFLQSITNPEKMKRNLIFNSEFLVIDIPTPHNGTTNFILRQDSVFASHAQIVLDYKEVNVQMAPLFLGHVVDDKDSIVSLSFPYVTSGDPTPLGMVHKKKGTYSIAKSSSVKRLVDGDGLVLVELNPTSGPPEDVDLEKMGCTVTRGENPLLDSIEKELSNVKRSLQDGSNGITNWNGIYYEVEIAVETDSLTYTAFSTIDLLTNYINVVYGVVTGIYTRDFYATVKIVFLGIHSPDTNPPSDAASMNTHMSQQHPTVVHDVGVLIQGTFSSGWSQGTGTVCTSSKYSQVGFAFKYGQPTEYNALHDPYITAHEIGHQLGSIHTHEMNPQVDNCGNGGPVPSDGGVLMSYCILVSDSPLFQAPCWSYCNINAMIMGQVGAHGYQSERVNQVIRAVLENATCLSPSTSLPPSISPPTLPPPQSTPPPPPPSTPPPPPPSNPPPPSTPPPPPPSNPPPPSTPPPPPPPSTPPPPPPSTPPPPPSTPPPPTSTWSSCMANYWNGQTNIQTPCTGIPWLSTSGTWFCPTSLDTDYSYPVILTSTCLASSFAVSEETAKQESGLSVGAWVGIGVSVTAGVVLLVLVTIVVVRRQPKIEERY